MVIDYKLLFWNEIYVYISRITYNKQVISILE